MTTNYKAKLSSLHLKIIPSYRQPCEVLTSHDQSQNNTWNESLYSTTYIKQSQNPQKKSGESRKRFWRVRVRRRRRRIIMAATIINGEEEKNATTTTTMTMTPWEQHSSVISLPRFDYNAPSSLLLHSHSGFLITCTIKREKSATKEAISILNKFFGPSSNTENTDTASKRRKTSTPEEETDSAADGKPSSSDKAEVDKDGGVSELSLVKLTRNGLLLFTFPNNNTLHHIVDIVSNIIQASESGSLSLPLWCHRIFPIQATCVLNEKELQEVVTTLVKKFVDAKKDSLERPLKFAVGFNRRGIEETKSVKENLNGSNSLLDRNKCFAVVASAVNNVVKDSVVDLKSPELSVLVELLPLSGVPNGSIVVAVSVLSKNLVSTKPRLCVKALTSNTKEGSVAQ